MISLTPVDDLILVESSKQRNAAPFDKLVLKLVPAPEGEGCVLRLAEDVLPAVTLRPAQRKAYSTLVDSFTSDGATKGEWQRTCQEIPERTFHRACKELVEAGFVQPVGTRFRLTSKEPRL